MLKSIIENDEKMQILYRKKEKIKKSSNFLHLKKVSIQIVEIQQNLSYLNKI